MIKLNNFFKFIATFGPLGNFKGSGTIGSLVAMPAVYLLYFLFEQKIWPVLLFSVVLIISYFIIRKACRNFLSNDPSEIILDEFVGCLLTFCCIPLNCNILATGFILFRFFDITKIFGIGFLEKKFKGPSGIMVDDLAAGFISNMILRILFI